ncbi:MAG: hypothetical protein GTO18_08210 [Anaerolineales bacterium]|nr:hypothetical protein [Anaerolineales bacterium]
MGLKIHIRLLLILYLFFAIGYSVLIPIWEAPDEPAHYQLVLSIARTGQKPSLENNYEAHQPQLYYRLASLPITMLDRIDPTYVEYFAPEQRSWRSVPYYDWNAGNYRLLMGVMVLRIFNLLLGSGSIYLMYLAIRLIFPNDSGVVASTISFIALLPQFLHNISTVNNDAMSILAGALLFLLAARICRDHAKDFEKVLAAFLAILLPITIKLTLIPISITAVLLVIWHYRKRWQIWAFIAFVFLTTMLIASQTSYSPQHIITRIFLDIHPDVSKRPLWQMIGLFAWSFWGKIGWLNLEALGLPIALITLLSLLAFGGAATNLWQTFRKQSKPTNTDIPIQRVGLLCGPEYRQCRSMLWLATTLALISAARFAIAEHQFQGRFLFPTITPMALIIVTGWASINPQKYSAYLFPLTLAIMVLLNLYLWFFKIIPVFYQPLLG